MSCKYNNQCGKVCDHFVVTTAVTFADGTLTLTLPDDVTYGDGNHFCIVIGQTIPAETTINAPVVAVIGTGATEFPLLTRCGDPVVSQQVDVRRKYRINIIAVKNGNMLNPNLGPDYRFREGDHLIVIGRSDEVFKLSAKA